MLGSVTDFMSIKFDFGNRGELELLRKENWLKDKVSLEWFQVWFTDGSRVDTGTRTDDHMQRGFSVHIFLGRWVSVIQAKVYALAGCSKFAMETDRANRNIAIFSDR